jgi:hypothetical protein
LPSLVNKAKVGWALARGLTLSEFAGAAGLGTTAAFVAGAGAVGYGVGTLGYKAAEGTAAGDFLADKVGGSIAKVLALFGNDEARHAVEVNERNQKVTQALIDQVKRTDLGGTLQIQIQTSPGIEAQASANMNYPALKANVGRTMQGAN